MGFLFGPQRHAGQHGHYPQQPMGTHTHHPPYPNHLPYGYHGHTDLHAYQPPVQTMNSDTYVMPYETVGAPQHMYTHSGMAPQDVYYNPHPSNIYDAHNVQMAAYPHAHPPYYYGEGEHFKPMSRLSGYDGEQLYNRSGEYFNYK